MSKPIPQEIIEEFNDFCARKLAGEPDGAEFGLSELPFIDEDEDDEWEFHAANYDPDTSYDIYDLFAKSDFSIEQHQYDEFWVVPT